MFWSGLYDHPEILLINEIVSFDGDGLDVEAVGLFYEFEEEFVCVLSQSCNTSVTKDLVSWVTTLNSLPIFIMMPLWFTQMDSFEISLLS